MHTSLSRAVVLPAGLRLADGELLLADRDAPLVRFLGEDAVLRVQELNLARREDPEDAVVRDLERPQLRAEREALLLAGEIHDVVTAAHDRGSFFAARSQPPVLPSKMGNRSSLSLTIMFTFAAAVRRAVGVRCVAGTKPRAPGAMAHSASSRARPICATLLRDTLA